MNCPYCGAKVHDPELTDYCSSCGKRLPMFTKDEKNGVLYRNIAAVIFPLALILIILGFSLLLPEIIVAYIGALDGQTLYWPVQFYLLVAGIVLMIVRHPFAKRSAAASLQTLRAIEAQYICSYCGKKNASGTRECESCGAPLK